MAQEGRDERASFESRVLTCVRVRSLRKEQWLEDERKKAEDEYQRLHPFQPQVHTPPRQYAAVASKLSTNSPEFTTQWLSKQQQRAELNQRARLETEVSLDGAVGVALRASSVQHQPTS